MFMRVCTYVLAAAVVLGVAGAAGAQTQTTATSSGSDDGWKVNVYPLLDWVPLGIGIDVSLPPTGGSGGGGRSSTGGLTGRSSADSPCRTDSGESTPADCGPPSAATAGQSDVKRSMSDVIYAHAMGGFKVYKDLYVKGGVRRYALKNDIALAGYGGSQRKPGVWDPLIGLGYHYAGEKLEVHVTFDGGGFGVGADVDIASAFQVDWKPVALRIGRRLPGALLEGLRDPGRQDVHIQADDRRPHGRMGLYF